MNWTDIPTVWREREFYADLKEKDRYDYYDDPIGRRMTLDGGKSSEK